MTGAPIYRDTLALCGVLLAELELAAGYERLRGRMADAALRLLDAISLALAGFDRLERVADADAALCTLRTHLQLALELELLDEDAFLALELPRGGKGKA